MLKEALKKEENKFSVLEGNSLGSFKIVESREGEKTKGIRM